MKWHLFTIICPCLRQGVCLVLHKCEAQKHSNTLRFRSITPFSKKNLGILLIYFWLFLRLPKHKQGPMKHTMLHTTFDKATYKPSKTNDVFWMQEMFFLIAAMFCVSWCCCIVYTSIHIISNNAHTSTHLYTSVNKHKCTHANQYTQMHISTNSTQ